METWKSVVGWEDYYEVSNLGRVRRPPNSKHRYKTELIIKASPCKGNIGYLRVCLKATVNGAKVQKDKYVHALVCEAFCGPKPPGAMIRHVDGNHLNNSSSNLVWGTRIENERDKILHGTSNIGRKRVNLPDGRFMKIHPEQSASFLTR